MIDPTHAAMCMAEHQQQAEIARLRAALATAERERDEARERIIHLEKQLLAIHLAASAAITHGDSAPEDENGNRAATPAPQTPSEGGTP